MRLDDLDPSSNVEDLGQGSGGFGGFGGGRGGGLGSILFGILPMLLGRRLGCGTVLLIAVVGFFLMNSGMLNLGGSGTGTSSPTQQGSGGNVACDTADELFSCKVLASTEQTWGQVFQKAGQQYRPAKLKFYEQGAQSGCGAAQSAMGPFYCPSDESVYLDTGFYQQLKQMSGAQGNFAQAYVIAHEIGHHIQKLTGTADQVRQAQERASQEQGNHLQVLMELQADCYAGLWASANAGRMDPGDIEQGMAAANSIGDDTLMEQAGRRPAESMFTHGSSEQRMGWLKRGLQSGGNVRACDTFLQGAV
jgi:uncharacterized protein